MENDLVNYKRVALENRLIDFALKIRDILNQLPKDVFSSNLQNQLSRSSTSSAFNYGEAQSAESKKDFIHKLGICLKELRETHVGLKFIARGHYKLNQQDLTFLLRENNELISIFVNSIQTTSKNKAKPENK